MKIFNIEQWSIWSTWGFCMIAIVALTIGIAERFKPVAPTKTIETNVESIESFNKVKDKIVIQTENLDSIKNVETIKVRKLDRDSTVELFYKLVKE